MSPENAHLSTATMLLSESISREPARDSRIVEFYIFPVIFLIGTVCNILTFIVMRRKKMRHQSTYFYMAVLAMADEMVLTVGCLNYWIWIYTGKNIILLSNITCKLGCLLLYATFHFSVWTVVIMTIERFIAVALPLQASHLCTVKRAKSATVLLAIIILLINVHFLFTHTLITHHDPISCSPISTTAEEFMNNIWPWIDASIYSFIPLTLLIIFNILIIYNLLKASKNIKMLNGNQNRRNSGVSKMVTVSPEPSEQHSAMARSSRNIDNFSKEYPSKNTQNVENLNMSSREYNGFKVFCCNLKSDSNSDIISAYPNKRVYKFKHIKSSLEKDANLTISECKHLTSNAYHQQSDNSSPDVIKSSTNLKPTQVKEQASRSSAVTLSSSTTYITAQQQAQQAQSSAASRRLTIMLLLVSLTFFITSTPIVTLQTVEQAHLINSSKYLHILRGIFLILQYLNHSANFFLYAVTGKTFRREFFALFKPCKKNINNSKRFNNKNLLSTTKQVHNNKKSSPYSLEPVRRSQNVCNNTNS